MPRNLQHIEMANKIRLNVSARIIDRIAHSRLRAEMDDTIELSTVEREGKRPVVSKVNLHELESPAATLALEAGDAIALQTDIVIIVQIVDADYAIAPLHKAASNMIADKTGCPRDQGSHNSPTKAAPLQRK